MLRHVAVVSMPLVTRDSRVEPASPLWNRWLSPTVRVLFSSSFCQLILRILPRGLPSAVTSACLLMGKLVFFTLAFSRVNWEYLETAGGEFSLIVLITVVLIIITVVPSIILAMSEAELKSRCSSNPLDRLFLESYSSLSSGLGEPCCWNIARSSGHFPWPMFSLLE